MGRSYTPEDILEEVGAVTELGESLGNFLYHTSKKFDVSVEALVYRAINANAKELGELQSR